MPTHDDGRPPGRDEAGREEETRAALLRLIELVAARVAERLLRRDATRQPTEGEDGGGPTADRDVGGHGPGGQ